MEIRFVIESCKKGNRDAQKKLYDLFSSKLFSICLRYSGNREEAKDLLQESFIKIYQNIGKFSDEGSFEGWCRRITTNTALSYLKSRAFFYAFESDESEKAANVGATKHSDNLEMNDLLNLLNQLSVQKKVIFNLYEIEGYSHGEIAEMLGITEGASRGQLAKAKEQLRQWHTQLNAPGNHAAH